MRIDQEIINFFEKQDSVIISTIDPAGCIHCSIKGIVEAQADSKIFLVDLYLYRTFQNLKKNPTVSITAVDEHLFKGYTLQGVAEIVPRDKINEEIFEAWERRVIGRISKRVTKSVKTGLKSSKHHEAHLPVHPKYLISVTVNNIIDLRPPHRQDVKISS
jgi:uncharacterized pyridoxamine 5'-phosphate oxidase family protein